MKTTDRTRFFWYLKETALTVIKLSCRGCNCLSNPILLPLPKSLWEPICACVPPPYSFHSFLFPIFATLKGKMPATSIWRPLKLHEVLDKCLFAVTVMVFGLMSFTVLYHKYGLSILDLLSSNFSIYWWCRLSNHRFLVWNYFKNLFHLNETCTFLKKWKVKTQINHYQQQFTHLF